MTNRRNVLRRLSAPRVRPGKMPTPARDLHSPVAKGGPGGALVTKMGESHTMHSPEPPLRKGGTKRSPDSRLRLRRVKRSRFAHCLDHPADRTGIGSGRSSIRVERPGRGGRASRGGRPRRRRPFEVGLRVGNRTSRGADPGRRPEGRDTPALGHHRPGRASGLDRGRGQAVAGCHTRVEGAAPGRRQRGQADRLAGPERPAAEAPARVCRWDHRSECPADSAPADSDRRPLFRCSWTAPGGRPLHQSGSVRFPEERREELRRRPAAGHWSRDS